VHFFLGLVMSLDHFTQLVRHVVGTMFLGFYSFYHHVVGHGIIVAVNENPTLPVLDEQGISADLDLSSLLASLLADDKLVGRVLTNVARRSVLATMTTNTPKSSPPIQNSTDTWYYQFSLVFPSGPPLMLTELAISSIDMTTIVVTMNGAPFVAATGNSTLVVERPMLWIPPGTRLDLFGNAGPIIAHAIAYQLEV